MAQFTVKYKALELIKLWARYILVVSFRQNMFGLS